MTQGVERPPGCGSWAARGKEVPPEESSCKAGPLAGSGSEEGPGNTVGLCCCPLPPALAFTDLFLQGSTPAPWTEFLTRGLEVLLQPPAGPAFTRDTGWGKQPQPKPSVHCPEVLQLDVDQF